MEINNEVEYYDKAPDVYGRIWMQTFDLSEKKSGLKALSLRKKLLGDFVFYALKHEAEIGSFYCLNAKFNGAWTGASIRIRPDRIEQFQLDTGVGLRTPPKLKLN